MSLVKDIGDLLEQQGIGTVGVDICCGDMPESPDEMTGVFEYAGKPPLTIAPLDRPGLQIRSRGVSYEDVRSRMQDIQNLLIRVGDADDPGYREGVSINGTQYLRIEPVQNPIPLGRDNLERIEFAQNYEITLRR